MHNFCSFSRLAWTLNIKCHKFFLSWYSLIGFPWSAKIVYTTFLKWHNLWKLCLENLALYGIVSFSPLPHGSWRHSHSTSYLYIVLSMRFTLCDVIWLVVTKWGGVWDNSSCPQIFAIDVHKSYVLCSSKIKTEIDIHGVQLHCPLTYNVQ